jgi:hypothetical protein
VTAGLHEGGHGRGSKSTGNSEAALVHIHLSVPSSPDLGGSEHASSTAHVSWPRVKAKKDKKRSITYIIAIYLPNNMKIQRRKTKENKIKQESKAEKQRRGRMQKQSTVT